MDRNKHDIAIRLVKFSNLILAALPFVFVWFFYYLDHVIIRYQGKGNLLVIFLFLFLYTYFGHTFDAFLISLHRISEMIYSQMLSAFATDCVMYIVITLLSRQLANPIALILCLIAQGGMIVVWSCASHQWYFRHYAAQKSIVIYDMRPGLDKLIYQYGLSKKFDITDTITIDSCLRDLSVLDQTTNVFMSGIHSRERNIVLKYCVDRGITVYVIPRVGDLIMSGARRMHMFHLPMLRAGRYQPNTEYLLAKRVTDIVVSGIALIILSPILLAVSIAIKREDGGPVFYKQKRLTKDGKVFEIIKFRSMRTDAEKDGVARLSSGDHDDRITKVGRFIRKCRMDELPQLLNILEGSLSLVGPRPERPEIAAEYEKTIPEFRLRLQAKAGLTGYAQVYGQYNTTPYDKLQMDLMYIAHPSFFEDLRIMIATVKILFLPESTEGIAEGQTTAMMNEYTEEDV